MSDIVERQCGYTIVRDGIEEPCERPATSWRWYQDVEHEDCLERACEQHANIGGIHMAKLTAELDRLRPRRIEDEGLARKMVQAAVWMKRTYQDAGLNIARIFCEATGIDADALEHELRAPEAP